MAKPHDRRHLAEQEALVRTLHEARMAAMQQYGPFSAAYRKASSAYDQENRRYQTMELDHARQQSQLESEELGQYIQQRFGQLRREVQAIQIPEADASWDSPLDYIDVDSAPAEPAYAWDISGAPKGLPAAPGGMDGLPAGDQEALEAVLHQLGLPAGEEHR